MGVVQHTQIYRKQTPPFRRPPARQYSPELGCRGGSGLSDMQGEGPVKHRPPMRAPCAAVAARKWPFTPVLRADWNALRSTGLSAPRAADRSPALPRTQLGSHYAPHTKWQQWGSTRDARGPPGGNLCTWHARRGASSSSPDGKSRRLQSPATLLKATQMARAWALPVTDAP